MKCYISHKILGLGRRKSDIVITPPWKCKFAKINDKQSCSLRIQPPLIRSRYYVRRERMRGGCIRRLYNHVQIDRSRKSCVIYFSLKRAKNCLCKYLNPEIFTLLRKMFISILSSVSSSVSSRLTNRLLQLLSYNDQSIPYNIY